MLRSGTGPGLHSSGAGTVTDPDPTRSDYEVVAGCLFAWSSWWWLPGWKGENLRGLLQGAASTSQFLNPVAPQQAWGPLHPPSGVTGSLSLGLIRASGRQLSPQLRSLEGGFLPVEQDPAVLHVEDQVSRREGPCLKAGASLACFLILYSFAHCEH